MSARPPASRAAWCFTAVRPQGLRPSRAIANPAASVRPPPCCRRARRARRNGWLRLTGVTRNNLNNLDVAFPLGVFTTVTGVSGSGKSSLVSQALVELVARASRPRRRLPTKTKCEELERRDARHHRRPDRRRHGSHQAPGAGGSEADRPHAALEPGHLHRAFDHVRKLFAATKAARAHHYDAGRFSFNVAKGRCETCEGEGFVMVELLFLPSVYAPCPTCHGARYNAKTLEIKYRDKTIADVLGMTVDAAWEFFADESPVLSLARRAARSRPGLSAARPAGH